jgi:uncharacterized membrane protein YcaP (DUF421 family)
MFFHSWSDIGRAIAVSAMIFLSIVALLRLTGQRALAKMSAYDVVFSVTLGSLIATVAVTRDITLSEGLAAVVTMLMLQEGIRWLQARNLRAHHLIREPPAVVLWDGQLLEDRLKEDSISADEVRAAVRRAGLRSLGDAQIVVLENDGAWSVIRRERRETDDSALLGLPIPGRPGNSPAHEGSRAEPAPATRIP